MPWDWHCQCANSRSVELIYACFTESTNSSDSYFRQVMHCFYVPDFLLSRTMLADTQEIGRRYVDELMYVCMICTLSSTLFLFNELVG